MANNENFHFLMKFGSTEAHDEAQTFLRHELTESFAISQTINGLKAACFAEKARNMSVRNSFEAPMAQ